MRSLHSAPGLTAWLANLLLVAICMTGGMTGAAAETGHPVGSFYLTGTLAGTYANDDESEVQAALDDRGHNVDYEQSGGSHGYLLAVGYQFLPHLAAELIWADLGDFESTVSGSVPNQDALIDDLEDLHPVAPRGLGLALAPGVRLGHGFSAKGRFGIFYAFESELEFQVNGNTIRRDQDDFYGMLGGGLDYALWQGLSLGVRFDSFIGAGDAGDNGHAYGLELGYRFGQ